MNAYRFVPVPVSDIFPGDICYMKATVKDWGGYDNEIFTMVEILEIKEKCIEVKLVAAESICILAAKDKIYRQQTNCYKFRTSV